MIFFKSRERGELARPRLAPYDAKDTTCLYLAAGPLLFFGLLCLYETFKPESKLDEVMSWICPLIGVGLAGPGVILVVLGVAIQRRLARVRKSMEELFEGPWLVDRWTPPEARDLLRRGVALPLAIGVFLGVILTPLTFVVLQSGKGKDLGLLLLANLIPLAALGLAAYRAGRGLKYRDGWLRYEELPLSASEPIRLTYRAPDALRAEGAAEEVAFVLRCVEQTFKNTKGRNGLINTVRHAEERTLKVADLEPEQALEFTLPEPARQGTDLHDEQLVRYYELEVSAEAEGIDYRAIYLLPVYKV